MSSVQARRRFLIFGRKQQPVRSIRSAVRAIDSLSAILAEVARLLEAKAVNGPSRSVEEEKYNLLPIEHDIDQDIDHWTWQPNLKVCLLASATIGLAIGPIVGYLTYGGGIYLATLNLLGL